MKEWQKKFLKEMFHNECSAKEEDFEEVYEFLLKQIPYTKRRTVLNFTSLVKRSVSEPDIAKNANYRMLQARTKECLSSIQPRCELVFTLGKDYIEAYNEFSRAQEQLNKANEVLLQMEVSWLQQQEENQDVAEKTESAQKTSENKAEIKINITEKIILQAKQTEIEFLGLNPGAYNRLKRMGINTIHQLCCLPEEELAAVKGIGRKNYENIKKCLYAKGYRIGLFV